MGTPVETPERQTTPGSTRGLGLLVHVVERPADGPAKVVTLFGAGVAPVVVRVLPNIRLPLLQFALRTPRTVGVQDEPLTRTRSLVVSW